MTSQTEDPFYYLLSQKINTIHNQQNKYHNNIRLNLNKLPHDFFQKTHKNTKLTSHRNSPKHFNEFLIYNKTVELTRPGKITASKKTHLKRLASEPKRELTAPDKKRPEKRRFTEIKDSVEGFNCTFAKKMYVECPEQKKIQLPLLDSARRPQKLKIQTII